MAVVLAACTATPGATVIVEHDKQSDPVIVHDEAGTPDAGDAAVDASADDAATHDAGVDADAAPSFVCTGHVPLGGGTGTNCFVLGACGLPTCTQGVAYACYPPAGGTSTGEYPVALTSAVYSAHDSMQNGVTAHCGEPKCVRATGADAGLCNGKGMSYSCAPGVIPDVVAPVQCAVSVAGSMIYCCS